MHPSARGFSLIEVLVALAIFALLSAAGVAVLAQSADNREVVRGHMARLAELQRARAMLAADLAQAAPRVVRDADGRQARDAFIARGQGDPDRLFALVRHGWENPDAAPRASLQFVEYRLRQGRLERATRPMLDGTASGGDRVLLRGIRAAEVRYLHQGQWQDGWPGGVHSLPQALALDLQFEDGRQLRQFFAMPGLEP
ncbi:type II secretion system minor pseudopilin GspJ [Luteimonas sp. e5]